MDYGMMIDENRKEAGISLRGLARAAGISPTYLSHIMTGHVPPPKAEKVEKIARALGQEPESHLRAAGRWEEHAIKNIDQSATKRSALELVLAMDEAELEGLLSEIR